MYVSITNHTLKNHWQEILVSGRGLLGRWGPNHAGDPVVTRWAKQQDPKKPKVLEIILITRKDSGELALPGGMVDAGLVRIFHRFHAFKKLLFSSEHVSAAIKREFIEETMNSNSNGEKLVEELFKQAQSVIIRH